MKKLMYKACKKQSSPRPLEDVSESDASDSELTSRHRTMASFS